jgi:uncharacterized protein YlxW (UPF0749 family)
MTLLTEMMQRPLDPSYAAAAESRERSGLAAATGHHSPLLILVAVLIGALLATSALALRAPTTSARKVKSDLVGRIEARREHADSQTKLIADLRNQINTAQASALRQQNEGGLAADLSQLELAAGTLPVSGPGLVLTLDNAEAPVAKDPGSEPGPVAEPKNDGTVLALDLQIIVNGLWEAGAEAIAINGHRLTSRAAIRFAGEAILVNYRPLTRPYVINVIGDPSNLRVAFADNSGGAHFFGLRTNYGMLTDIQVRESVTVAGEPSLSLQIAAPAPPATKKQSSGTPSPGTPHTTETPP